MLDFGVKILERGTNVLDGTSEELELGKLALTASVDEEGEDVFKEGDVTVVEGKEEPLRVRGVLVERAKAVAALGKFTAMVKSQQLVVITEKIDHY